MANTLIISNFTENSTLFVIVKMSDVISQMGSLAEAILPKHTAKLSKKFKTLFIETLILYVVMQKTNFTQLGTFGTARPANIRQDSDTSGLELQARSSGVLRYLVWAS